MDDKREDTTQALIESLKERYPKRGFLIHPAVKFRFSHTDGMNVVAQAPIEKGETLLVIPEDALFSVSNVMTTDNLKSLHKDILKKCHEHHPEDISLAVAIMHVLSKKNKGQAAPTSSLLEPFFLQAATWPPEEAMKESSLFYWDDCKVRNIWNKSGLTETFEGYHKIVRHVFDSVLFPLLRDDADNFIDSNLPSNNICETMTTKVALWNTFIYAYSLCWSRAHGSTNPGLVPVVELLNGNSEIVNQHAKKGKLVDKTIINVKIAKGAWPFGRWGVYKNECNLSCSAVYATRDIEEGEELIISYGEQSPLQFMVRYGVIPNDLLTHHNIKSDVSLWCCPSFIPDHPKRVACLRKNGYPLEELKSNETILCELKKDCLDNYALGEEPDDIKRTRQMVILSVLADDEELDRNLAIDALRGYRYQTEALQLMCKLIDYNLELLAPGMIVTSADDVESANKQDTPAWKKTALFARVIYRENLIMWRHIIGNIEGISHVDGNHDGDHFCLADGGCNVCGRTYPCSRCSRCKQVRYCSRGHQMLDWKFHKVNCGN